MAWVKSKALGDGCQGEVSLATRHGYAPLAVKSAHFWDSELLEQEGKVLFQLKDCSNIITCYGEDFSMEKQKKTYNLLLEFASGGSLHDLIARAGGKLPEHEVRQYTYMVLRGLACMHDRNYVHCDIKPKNILVFPSDDGKSNKLKIADLGLVKAKDEDDMVYQIEEKMDRYRGTPQYTSPESVIIGMNEAPKDIWALGCTVLEMFTGKMPWRMMDREDILYELGFGTELPEIPEELSEEVKDFLRWCFERDYRRRPTAKMLLNHSFVRSGKVEEMSSSSGDRQWICVKGMFEPGEGEVRPQLAASTSCLVRRSYAQALLNRPVVPPRAQICC